MRRGWSGGVGNVTGTGGTVSFTGTTTTAKSFVMTNGTIAVSGGQTVTFNGGPVAGLTLDGPGAFATSSGGARFVNVTSTPAATITSNSPNDVFQHFTDGGALTVAPTINTNGMSTTVNLDGFTIQAGGSVTIGFSSKINVANFQSSGTLILSPANSPPNDTRMTHLGAAPLIFGGGSQTFIGSPALGPQNNAVLDLHGHNAIVAGGLFVNNGFVGSATVGPTIVADYGALVKGAGTFQSPIITQNGGRFQAGNSPGKATFGSLVLGPGGTQNFNWQINNAAGTAEPVPDAFGRVSGWSLLNSEQYVDPLTGRVSTGDLTWSATSSPGSQFNMALQTLINPIAVGQDTLGLMANFNDERNYEWKFVQWQGSYSGPTDDATLTGTAVFDTSNFLNPIDPVYGRFSLHYNAAGKEIDLVYSVPEPGTVALTALAAIGLAWRRFRRFPV